MYDIYVNSQFLKTPSGNRFEVPTLDLAKAIEEEWAKDTSSHYRQKPMTSLVATALDCIAGDQDRYVNEVLQSISTDALLYWATSPESLVKLQEERWIPILDQVNRMLGFVLKPTTAFSVAMLSPEDQDNLKAFLYHQSIFVLAGLVHLVQLSHSFCISYLLLQGKLSPEEAWDLAHLHEHEQGRVWGKDEEAALKEEEKHKEFIETVRFLKLIYPSS